ncbi:ATPase family associated with various cellular activities (AAA) domain-containing protein [Ditylenchus destructor]|nr:ATPase family associated with various cellular activities (AAA) domain-containing protein [Ditylenchus destructor]
MDPNFEANRQAKARVAAMMLKLKLNPKEQLTPYETRIATMLVSGDEGVEWSIIGGCDSLLSELNERVITPLRLKSSPAFSRSALFSPAKGVLLHGPPGCGKTLIARAIARASGANFIHFDTSVIHDKWYGETQKLTSALFSLAKKIQPCIIFIDEIDSFLRSRNSFDHEISAQTKAMFMSLWDGFFASDDSIIILGATNRPHDIDAAILRRLPLRFMIPMPGIDSRVDILRVILKDEKMANDIDLYKVAEKAPNTSGSDLKEICRNAALRCLSTVMKASAESHSLPNLNELEITEDDLIYSAQKFVISYQQTKKKKCNIEFETPNLD